MHNNPFRNWRPGLRGGASPEFYKNALIAVYIVLAAMLIFCMILASGLFGT